jgi:hypothetical protein
MEAVQSSAHASLTMGTFKNYNFQAEDIFDGGPSLPLVYFQQAKISHYRPAILASANVAFSGRVMQLELFMAQMEECAQLKRTTFP